MSIVFVTTNSKANTLIDSFKNIRVLFRKLSIWILNIQKLHHIHKKWMGYFLFEIKKTFLMNFSFGSTYFSEMSTNNKRNSVTTRQMSESRAIITTTNKKKKKKNGFKFKVLPIFVCLFNCWNYCQFEQNFAKFEKCNDTWRCYW